PAQTQALHWMVFSPPCTGAYAVDELLSEGQLSQELGIGRTPVREALQRLEAHRLVTIVPRQGLLVTNFDTYDLSRLIEARRPLESMLCRLAARNADREARAQLGAVIRGIEGITDYEDGEAIELDQAAKILLLQAAGNIFLEDAIAPVHGLSRALYFRRRSTPDLDVVLAQLGMLRAVVDGNEHEAALGAIRFVAEVARVMRQRR
uniref:GntR family transcriptional regulator n=1 Tax=uncultured Bosea sp. TaxID=211457 RepID=UPI0025FEF6BB